MSNKEWFKQAQYGMMIHWGLYCLPAGEWNGVRTNRLGEWILHDLQIPLSEYRPLAKAFNPILFNADDWVQLAKDSPKLGRQSQSRSWKFKNPIKPPCFLVTQSCPTPCDPMDYSPPGSFGP